MSDPVGTRRTMENVAASCGCSHVRALDIVGAAPYLCTCDACSAAFQKPTIFTIWCDKSWKKQNLNNSFDENFNTSRTSLLENGHGAQSSSANYGANGNASMPHGEKKLI